MKSLKSVRIGLATTAALGLSSRGLALSIAPAAHAQSCPTSNYNVSFDIQKVWVDSAGLHSQHVDGAPASSGLYSNFFVKTVTTPATGPGFQTFRVGTAVNGPNPISQRILDGPGRTQRQYNVPNSVQTWTYKVKPCSTLVVNSSVVRAFTDFQTGEVTDVRNLGGGNAYDLDTIEQLKVPEPGKSKEFFFNYVLDEGDAYTSIWVTGTVKTTTKA